MIRIDSLALSKYPTTFPKNDSGMVYNINKQREFYLPLESLLSTATFQNQQLKLFINYAFTQPALCIYTINILSST